MSGPCPACGAGSLVVLHEQRDIPTNSCLLLDADEAVAYPRGEMRLGFCGTCVRNDLGFCVAY